MRAMHILGLTVCLVFAFRAIASAHDTQIIQAGPQLVQPVQPAQVQIVQPAPLRDEPSPFTYGLQGFVGGALLGAGIGYLVYDQNETGDGIEVALGAGFGALSGAGLGLSLGLFDASEREPSRLRFVMRDALYGSLTGGLLGSVAGGLFALDSGDGRDALLGGSIGLISGFGLGMVVGLLHGHWQRSHPARVTTTISVSQDDSGRRVLLPSVMGRF